MSLFVLFQASSFFSKANSISKKKMSTCIYKSKIKINKVKINNKNKINFSYPWCLCYCCFLEPGPWKRFGFSAMWWYLYFLAHCDKVPPQKQLKEGMVCCVSRSDAAVLGGEGEGTEMGGGWSHCVQSQETERKEFWCSAGSPVFFLGLLYSVCSLSSYSGGFLASGNLRVDALTDTSRGMAPRWLSNPVQLTMAIKQHTSTWTPFYKRWCLSLCHYTNYVSLSFYIISTVLNNII